MWTIFLRLSEPCALFAPSSTELYYCKSSCQSLCLLALQVLHTSYSATLSDYILIKTKASLQEENSWLCYKHPSPHVQFTKRSWGALIFQHLYCTRECSLLCLTQAIWHQLSLGHDQLGTCRADPMWMSPSYSGGMSKEEFPSWHTPCTALAVPSILMHSVWYHKHRWLVLNLAAVKIC